MTYIPAARNQGPMFLRRLLNLNAKPQSSPAILVRSLSAASTTSPPPPVQPIVELREYTLFPQHVTTYMTATTETADLRQSISPGFRFFCLPETGGLLNVPTHAYYYGGGHAQRNQVRANMALNQEWRDYVQTIGPCLQSMQSHIYVEAPSLLQNHLMMGLENVSQLAQLHRGFADENCILEVRRYHLQLGYDTVPKFLQYYQEGLPSKLEAPGTDPTTSLITVLYTEVGRLNEVIEIWRHGNGTHAMEQSRQAARSAQEWRTAIAHIAGLAVQFTSTIHKPTSFSPLR